MNEPGLGIHADVSLHAEVPFIALLDLVHLRIALAIVVLGGARGGNDGGVDNRAGLEHQPLLSETGVDEGQYLRRQLALLQQVPKAQDGRLVGHARRAIQPGKASIQRTLTKLFFHGRIAEVPPQLQAMDAQHRLDGERWTPAQSLMRTARVRLDQRHQLGPRHDAFHLVQEDLLAGLLGQRVKTKRALIHALIVADRRSHRQSG